MTFELSPDQIQKFEDWKSTLSKKYSGAIGGRFTFSFIPTGIGIITEIHEYHSGEKLDLTEYDLW